MSININMTSGFSSAFTGLKDYFDHYQTTYTSPGHASDMWFHNNPGSLDIGGTTYNDTYFGIKVIGEDLANTSTTSSNVSFLAKASEVTLENGAGTHYQSADMIYTGGTITTPPTAHRLAGDIGTLDFGNGAYASGSLASTLFNITGLTPHIGNGLLDNDSDGAYDAINSDTNTNLVHKLIFDLMGGMGGPGNTSVLEGFLNSYGTKQVGTAGNDTFDAFNAVDTLVLSGGNDTVNAGFQVGSGGDVIDLTGLNSFADAAAAASAVTYSGGNALLNYNDGASTHSVTLAGVASGITADNFIV